ncbi:hypothetical protein ACF0H5_010902 [Mactra antiquata]
MERGLSVLLLILCSISVLNASPSAVEDELKKNGEKTILVFGGNGFIGASTVQNLLRVNYTVVIINRGNWYWDSAETVRPYVKLLKCDRMQSLQKCSDLQHYLWSLDTPTLFEALIDFSAYHSFEVNEALSLLRGKIRKYIYISSDSVYEVCNKTHSQLTREEDAIRPESKDDYDLYKSRDNYGNRKLECEEALVKQAEKDEGIPYISLRLPDVVGPRDNTYRWWLYQLWIRLSDYIDKPLTVPKNLWKQPLSFVFVDDVADSIVDIISGEKEIYNNAYNLCLKEMPTLVEYLHALMDAMDVEDINILEEPNDDSLHLFPSVRNGPIDCTKAQRLLNWNPTSWVDVLYKTVDFYENAITNEKFVAARKDVIRTLQQYFSKDPTTVITGLRQEYGITFNNNHDEL